MTESEKILCKMFIDDMMDQLKMDSSSCNEYKLIMQAIGYVEETENNAH